MHEQSSEPRRDVFLSSCFWDVDALSPLREETRRLFERRGVSLWTWEHWSMEGGFEELAIRYAPYPPPSFAQIAVFREALIKSRIVIVFVSRRRGSRIQPWPYTIVTYGTYFEIEVFFAIALGKPIILFREDGVSVDLPLEQLLGVARRSGAIHHEEEISRAELPQKSLDAYIGVSKRLRSPIARFTTFLAQRRDPYLDFHKIEPFLFGVSLPMVERHPDVDAHDQLMASAQEAALPLSERMSRVWLALQQLLPFRAEIARDQELARRWEAALDAWSYTASWFGLHSHLATSPLVAQAERARVVAAHPGLKLPIPYGPLSSARYSMARRQVIGRRRSHEMDKVIEEARLVVTSGGGDVAGSLSIIGFALLQKFHPIRAAEQFAESLRLRRLENDEGRIGEGLADLGLALFLSGRLWSGIELLEEGVDMLGRSNRHGFHLRTMKKLEFAYRVTGQWKKAADVRARRISKARSGEYFDQL